MNGLALNPVAQCQPHPQAPKMIQIAADVCCFNEKTWDAMPSEAKELLQIPAEAAGETILRFEPRMTERTKEKRKEESKCI
ncbi:hypothetical protein [Mitsuokella sp. oral taxon 131]|uniref:hypothetical protein n=1 Tax=Mitsuokella sp. oral taxon 131 TaxID=1321780 RepID=UPI0012DF41DE|nr:hypothetical protein [Mitsuokella sp. oral taxon 131]